MRHTKMIFKIATWLFVIINLYSYATWYFVAHKFNSFEESRTYFEQFVFMPARTYTYFLLILTIISFVYPILWHSEGKKINTIIIVVQSLFLLITVFGLL